MLCGEEARGSHQKSFDVFGEYAPLLLRGD